MSYRGIENFWGNLNTEIDGINIYSGGIPYVSDHSFVSTVYGNSTTGFQAPYATTGLTCCNTNAGSWVWPIDITTSSTYDYGFVPLTSGGGSSTYLTDSFILEGAQRQVLVGGEYDWGSVPNYAGAFNFLFFPQATDTAVTTGSRLMYMG